MKYHRLGRHRAALGLPMPAVFTSTPCAQIFEQRLEPMAQLGVFNDNNSGTPDQLRQQLRVIGPLTGANEYVALEYDIRGLTAADIEHAVIGGRQIVNSATPPVLRYTVFTGNDLLDLAGINGSVTVLDDQTFIRTIRNRWRLDVTSVLKDRINAGGDYFGLRIEAVNSINLSIVAARDTSDDASPDLYIHEVDTANDRTDPVAPGGLADGGRHHRGHRHLRIRQRAGAEDRLQLAFRDQRRRLQLPGGGCGPQ